MSETKDPQPEVLVNEWTWKTEAMRAMAVAVCQLALQRAGRAEGSPHGSFSALDLKQHGADAHGGTGIAGSVFRILGKMGIIGPVGQHVNGTFMQFRVHNAGGNPIGVWRLNSAALARALLERYGMATPKPVQLDLVPQHAA